MRFVDGSNTGIPAREVQVVEEPKADPLVQRQQIYRGGEQAGMKQDVFSLTEGDVILSWPTTLSQDSLDDLKAWLKIMERKISRSLVNDKAKQDEESDKTQA